MDWEKNEDKQKKKPHWLKLKNLYCNPMHKVELAVWTILYNQDWRHAIFGHTERRFLEEFGQHLSSSAEAATIDLTASKDFRLPLEIHDRK